MIWRPAPWLVTDPRPAVVGLPNPSSRLIWGPGCFLVWLPNVAIAGDVNPVTVAIKIIHARVIPVRMSPALCVAHHVVAIAIPYVPIVFIGRAANLIFRIGSPADIDNLACMHASATLRRGNFRFTFPHDHIRLRV